MKANLIFFLAMMLMVVMLTASSSAQKLWEQPVGTTFTYSRENNSNVVSTWVIEAENNSGFELSIKTSNDPCTYFRYFTVVNNSTVIVYRERGEGTSEQCKFDYTYTPGFILVSSATNFTSTSLRNDTVNNTATTIVTRGQTDQEGPIETPLANYTSTTHVLLVQRNTVDNSTVDTSVWFESKNFTIVKFTLNDGETFKITSIRFTEPSNSTSAVETSFATPLFSFTQFMSTTLLVVLGMFLLL